MKKLFIIFLTVVIFLLSSYSSRTDNQAENKIIKKTSSVKINNIEVKVDIADTPAASYRGLSWRKSLCENCGMLFIFPRKSNLDFVMRNMNFPLDIIFINGDKIVKIYKNLPPEGNEPKTAYGSGEPANYVLEVNGGFAEKNNIKIGDKIIYAK